MVPEFPFGRKTDVTWPTFSESNAFECAGCIFAPFKIVHMLRMSVLYIQLAILGKCMHIVIGCHVICMSAYISHCLLYLCDLP